MFRIFFLYIILINKEKEEKLSFNKHGKIEETF